MITPDNPSRTIILAYGDFKVGQEVKTTEYLRVVRGMPKHVEIVEMCLCQYYESLADVVDSRNRRDINYYLIKNYPLQVPQVILRGYETPQLTWGWFHISHIKKRKKK